MNQHLMFSSIVVFVKGEKKGEINIFFVPYILLQ